MSTIFHSMEAKLSDVGLAKCCVAEQRWPTLTRPAHGCTHLDMGQVCLVHLTV